MEFRLHPEAPIRRGIYLINPTATDMRHAQKRAAALGRGTPMPAPNRAVRRKLARRRRACG